MNKQTFLNSLREKLVGLPPDDIENRIEFYSEMIDDRIDEGKTEEAAISEIGTVDEVVNQIAEDTPLKKLVKEKIKPKRSLKAWEIVLLILGFPLWLPLTIVAAVLVLVAYILFWVFVIIAYVVEFSLVVAAVGGLVIFFAYLFNGNFYLIPLAVSLLGAGGAVLFFFACWYITKGTIELHKKLFTKIKAAFIKKGAKK